jgi:hypothetical protein
MFFKLLVESISSLSLNVCSDVPVNYFSVTQFNFCRSQGHSEEEFCKLVSKVNIQSVSHKKGNGKFNQILEIIYLERRW